MPNTVGAYLTITTNVLLIIFNAGMAIRVAKTYFDSLTSESGVEKKKIMTLVKAVAVINSLSVIVKLMAKYYTASN